MSLLTILQYPDPRLRKKAVKVTDFDTTLQQQIDAMFTTMYAAPGIGLAATQVNIHKQFFVLDVSEQQTEPMVFINPQLSQVDGMRDYEEGCLSFPGVYAKVERADSITVEAFDRDGEAFELQASGLLAVCIQHELDHLKGKLFVDYLSGLKRERIRKKLLKEMKTQKN